MAVQARQKAAATYKAAAAAQQHIQPWLREPTPAMFFEACRAAWHRQELAMRGWTLTSWHCKPRPGNAPEAGRIAIETSWNREGGLAVDVPDTLSADRQSANHSRKTSSPFGPPANVGVLPLAVARKNIWMLVQEHGLALYLTDLPLSPTQAGKDAPPPDPWIQVTANSTLAASSWLNLAAAPDVVLGLRVVDLDYDA